MLAFALASVALMAIPGPDMALIMRNAVVHGRRTGLATLAGGLAGISVHATASVIGLSALLAASATAFAVVKLVGAVYLTFLGVRALRRSALGWRTPRPIRSERSPCLIARRCARVG
jgi:threonine/homoserine/homoserine lactone efflux protein